MLVVDYRESHPTELRDIFDRRESESFELFNILGASSGGTFVGQFALGNPDLQPDVDIIIGAGTLIPSNAKSPLTWRCMADWRHCKLT